MQKWEVSSDGHVFEIIDYPHCACCAIHAAGYVCNWMCLEYIRYLWLGVGVLGQRKETNGGYQKYRDAAMIEIGMLEQLAKCTYYHNLFHFNGNHKNSSGGMWTFHFIMIICTFFGWVRRIYASKYDVMIPWLGNAEKNRRA